MKRWGVLLPLVLVAACEARLGLEIVGDGVVLDGRSLQIAVHPDIADGCEGLRFSPAPSTTPLSVAVVGAGSVTVPRAGRKVIVVEATDPASDERVGRGCAVVDDVDVGSSVVVTVRPTSRLIGLPAVTPVFAVDASSDVVVATVVDAAGDPRAGAVVRARVIDGFGEIVVEERLVADADGVVSFAPRLAAAGPVHVDLVAEQPIADGVGQLAAFVAPRVTEQAYEPGAVVVPAVIGGRGAFIAASSDAAGVRVTRRFVDGAGDVDGEDAAVVFAGAGTRARHLGVLHHDSLGGADSDGTFHLLVVDDRLIAVRDDGTVPAIVDDVALAAVPETVHLQAAGACRDDDDDSDDDDRDADRAPALLQLDAADAWVDVAFGGLVVVAAPALPVPVGGGCVVNESGGARRRLLFFADTVADPPVDLGSGIPSIRAVGAVVVGSIDVGTIAGRFAVRADGVAVVARVDGGTALLVPWVLRGSTLVPVDDSDDPALRLPSSPVFVAQGSLYGGTRDVLALLAIDDDDTATALLAISGDVSSGLSAVCSPARACATSRVVDVDDDGRLDLLTIRVDADTGAVRARVLRAR